MSSAPSPFSPEVQQAVAAHMNSDHPEDNLLIARSLGGLPGATDATMTGFDEAGAHFRAVVDGAPTPFQVPWDRPITERGDIRIEIVRMYHEACEALGVEPRAAGEH